MVGTAFVTDLLRMWMHNWKRFIAIVAITMLGVAVLTGIYAGCRDMFQAVNKFYNAQGLYDIQVISTLGLTQGDVAALRKVSGVETAQPERSQAASIRFGGADKSVTLREIGVGGLNQPYVQRGKLPTRAGEVAVTQKFIKDSGHRIGDHLTVSASNSAANTGSPRFPNGLTITAVVLDPQDLANPEGYQSGSFRSAATADYTFFAPSAGIAGNAYTAISLRVSGAAGVDTFTDSYANTVNAVINRIQGTIQTTRQNARRRQLVDTAQARINAARASMEQQFTAAQAQLDANVRAFDNQLNALGATTDAMRVQVIAQSPQLQQAKRQLGEAQATLDKKSAQARSQLAAKQAAIGSQIPASRWYVSSRTAMGSFSNLKSDITSIESIGRAFPVVFLVVAVLMSLTAMTRMVEENRGLIGTYSSLGYGRAAIGLHYVLFAAISCLLGGALGDVLGFLGIPALLLVILQGLYVVPGTALLFDWLYGLGGIALFVIGVVAATAIACHGEMRQTPSELLMPKAPRPGTRLLLERIRPLWRRMTFLHKVTARNLFRFKRRLFMTVGGVAGCTALIVCGLAINDTVAALGPQQYGNIYRYSLMVVGADGDTAALHNRLQTDGKTAETMDARLENGEIANAGAQSGSQSIQLVTVPSGAQLAHMVTLEDAEHGLRTLSLSDSGVIVSQSVANSLGIHAGSAVALKTSDAKRAKAKVTAVTRNLIGSDVYMSTAYYATLFGAGGGAKGVQLNAVFAKLRGSGDEQVAYAATLAKSSKVLSATSTVELKRTFNFSLMSAVVALIVALAGGLALAVLFTLVSTNVSERIREIATLKVLGFYDREVHRYINREMLLLTFMGIVVGLPMGRYIGGLLTSALNMPSLYFEVHITPWSYLIAAAATMVFSVLVQLLTNPVLDRVDPAGSLKSVE